MVRAFLVIAVCAVFVIQAQAAEGEVESQAGVVRQLSGDLAFVSGLNGSAPLGSQLQVDNGPSLEGTTLEVIKKLNDDLLVARVLVENGSPVKVLDRIRVVATQSAGEALRTVYAVRVDQAPKMDGRLDDAVWQEAKVIEGFVQRDPGYWVPSTERTVARIVYDNEKLYFGFECYDSEPHKVVANNMRRDSEVFGDDNVQILLDTYNDRQNGMFFFVNSLGAKRDLLLSQEGRTYNEDWDCVWESKGYRHDKGWSVEVAIPFAQMRFKEDDDAVWGINLSRFIARKSEASAIMIGQRSASSLQRYRTTDLAELRGLKALKTKRMFQVKPYALPGASKNLLAANPAATTSFESGVDVRYGLTPNMTLDLSYNTDFAQVEGDQEQVNLTQFPTFFPEKREFFLEGSTLFDFGEAATNRGGDNRPPTILFYSRRIGLESGQPVPILLGSKLAGKVGSTSMGLINALTDAKPRPDGTVIQRSNFSVFRVKQDVFSRSNIGAIFVNKQTNVPGSGWDAYNRAGGVDFSFSPSATVNFQGFYARTWDSAITDTDDARFFQGRYSGALLSGQVKFVDIEENFQPRAGYINRRAGLLGMRRYEVETRLRVQPNISGIRYISIGPRTRLFTDRDNNVKFWDTQLSWYTRVKAGDYLKFQATQSHDVVERTFRPSKKRPNVIIPHDTYDFTQFVLGTSPSRSRKFRPAIDFEFGTYYTGKKYAIELETAYRPSSQLSIETDYTINWLHLPQGNFNVQVLSNRLIYSFSTDFYVKLFAQWNNDSQLASMNFLVNYRYRPGSDIYLVYDQGYDTFSGLEERSRALLIKVSYMLGM